MRKEANVTKQLSKMPLPSELGCGFTHPKVKQQVTKLPRALFKTEQ